ncbi:hypothetical protein B0T22DRAFT_360418, partial [Podospora appendiculata]
MAVQLAPEVVGDAVAILIYSFFCLACSLFLFWLVWCHNERRSYVILLAFFMSLSIVASIIQQINTIVWWRSIKTAQYENLVANIGHTELNITGASTGLDLALFYIQYYCYNVEAMLVVCWAAELAQSIFQLRRRMAKLPMGLIAKGTAVFVPVLQMILLRTSAVQNSKFGFMVLADAILILSFLFGSVLLLGILVKYIHSRTALLSWKVQYGQHSGGTLPMSEARSQPGNVQSSPRRSIYDSWLVVRFTIAFVVLGLFELVVIFFQLRAANSNNVANLPAQPDLSPSKARTDFVLFVPGVSAGIFTYIVFGTTRTFREYLVKLVLPKRLWEKRELRRSRKK